jgi:hypothetical protein
MFERLFIAIEAVVLALWAGAMAGFAFIFAPVAIRIVPNMSTFATLIATTIRGVTTFGSVCGGIAIVAALFRASAARARGGAFARAGLVVVALAAGAYETSSVIPRMGATAALIPGPIDSVPKDDPRRVAYDREHQTSTRVYGLAFLCVLAAVVLAPFGRSESPLEG